MQVRYYLQEIQNHNASAWSAIAHGGILQVSTAIFWKRFTHIILHSSAAFTPSYYAILPAREENFGLFGEIRVDFPVNERWLTPRTSGGAKFYQKWVKVGQLVPLGSVQIRHTWNGLDGARPARDATLCTRRAMNA